ncbi:MAG: hypothetical protein HQL69_21715 [Magnetococcales bacterium]|nr:hypothetical protein [Magnetococcales bacterium]
MEYNIKDGLQILDEAHEKLVEAEETEKEALIRLRGMTNLRGFLFIDLSLSTQMKASYARQPHLWLKLYDWFYEFYGQAIHDNGGYVLKFIGDALMGVFEPDNPYARCDDVEIKRSVCNKMHSFARQAFSMADMYNSRSGHNDPKLKVKIAMDVGDVYLYPPPNKFLHPSVRDEAGLRDFLGLPIDRCARILGKAAAGCLLTSEYLYNYLDPNVQKNWKRLGLYKLKDVGHTFLFGFEQTSCDIPNQVVFDIPNGSKSVISADKLTTAYPVKWDYPVEKGRLTLLPLDNKSRWRLTDSEGRLMPTGGSQNSGETETLLKEGEQADWRHTTGARLNIQCLANRPEILKIYPESDSTAYYIQSM